MKTKKFWIGAFLAPAVLLFLLIYAVPLVMVFITSFMDYRLSAKDITFAGLSNYIRMFTDAGFGQALLNTVVWVFIHCILHVALGVSLALVLYKKPRGWKITRTVYMIPNIISSAALATIFVNFYNPQFGILNSLLKLLGLDSWQRNWLMDSKTSFISLTLIWTIFAGYTMTLVLARALSIDESVLEAARIDGASNRQIDFMIVLPLLRKIIGTTMVMAAAYMLKMFDIIYVTTGGGPGKSTTNLAVLLYGVYKSENNYGYANTIGVVIIILGAIFMTVINKTMRVNEDDF